MAELELNYEQQELDDLWKQAFVFGTRLDELHLLSRYNWSFSNLGDAFKAGGVLHMEKVYLFCQAEPHALSYNGQLRIINVPVVVVIVSPFPPSDKLGITSTQMASEKVVDMMEMNMGWVPYIPLRERGSSVERLNPQIFILSLVQIEAALELDHVENLEYCLPYLNNPFKVDETEQSTIVDITYPIEGRPLVYEFDWELDEPEELTNELIAAAELPRDHRDAFKEYVEEKVQEGRRANHEAIEKQIQDQEELMTLGRAAAFEQMRFYKFYPVATPDTPNISHVKCAYINRFYGHSHQVL